jgi:Flp pilus assembly protein TadG
MKCSFSSDNRALAALEMAIILPLLLVIIMAVLEFGLYFLKEQTASRAVSTASISLQQKADNDTIKLTMQNNGLSMMDLSAEPDNFVCARSYADASVADTSSCSRGDWITSRPAGVGETETYYIAVRAFATHTPLTPIRALTGAFPPDINSKNVIPVFPRGGWREIPPNTRIFNITCEYRVYNTNSGGTWSYATSVAANKLSFSSDTMTTTTSTTTNQIVQNLSFLYGIPITINSTSNSGGGFSVNIPGGGAGTCMNFPGGGFSPSYGGCPSGGSTTTTTITPVLPVDFTRIQERCE